MITSQLKHFRYLFIAAFLLGVAPSRSHAAWQQPPTPLNPSAGNAIGPGALGSDANGNAIALVGDSITGDLLAYDYTNGSWGTPTTLFVFTGDPVTYALSVNSPGQALATWSDVVFPSGDSHIYTAFFNGTSWSTPTPTPLYTSPTQNFNQAIALNDSGHGIAVWSGFSGQNITFSTFFGGTWTAPTAIPTGPIASLSDVPTPLAINNAGNAILAWVDSGSVVANNYIGGIWTQTTLGTSSGNAQVGIDSNGHAIVLWSDPSGNIEFSYWNGSSWSAASTISLVSGNGSFVSLAMAPGGTAVATWVNSVGNGIYSAFNGSTWGAPALFVSNLFGSFDSIDFAVSSDNAGNALIVYATTTPDVESVLLPIGGSLGPIQIVAPPDFEAGAILSSLSSDGIGFTLLSVFTEGIDFFASATIPVPNSLSVSGKVCKNKFANQSELVKIIKWSPSPDPTTVEYYLRRNGTLIAIIPSSGPFVYRDHKRCKKGGDTYTLTTVNASGVEGTAVTIKL